MSFFKITKNLIDNGLDLFYKNNPVAFAIDENTLFVSAAKGDDTSGIKGRRDRPFKTYAKVVEVLAAGDKVWFMPGSYATGNVQSDKADVSFYLQSAKLTGDVAMQGGNFSISSDGTGIVTGSIGYSGIDNSKTYYIKNLRRCGLLRGTIYVDGVHELHTMSDAAAYFVKNIQRLSATLYIVSELVNVREIVPQNSLIWARNAVIRNCRFYTAAANTRNLTFGTNNLGANEVVFNDCEFVSTQSYNFQANGEDLANGYIKWINCRFIAGAAYHLDMALHANFPNTKLNLTFIGCDIQKNPFVKTGVTSTTTDWRLTPQLTDNGSDLLYKGLGIATIVNQGNLVYVSMNGNDATALQGRMDRPFRNIQAAINSNLGQTVIVLGGHYYEQIDVRLYDHACTKLVLLYGAKIESNQTFTLKVGHNGFELIGQFFWHYNLYSSAIINTHATGVCYLRGGNPGGVSTYVENVSFHSTGASGQCLNYWDGFTANKCRFIAANTCLGYTYGNGIIAINCRNCHFIATNGYIANFREYSSVDGAFLDCTFSAPYGFYQGSISRNLLFKASRFTISVGSALDYQGVYNFVNKTTFEDCVVVASLHCVAGLTGHVEIENSKLISTTSYPLNLNLKAGYTAEIRRSKLIAEAAQTACVVNTNASNKAVNLIDVQMNKPLHANVAGVIHNVLIEDTLISL